MWSSNKLLLLLIVFSVACSSLAQLLLKIGMTSSKGADGASWQATLVAALVNPSVLAGLGLYVFGALVWLLVLSKVDLSFAYPFVGIGFILTLLLGRFALNEPVTLQRAAGTLLIALGVVLVAAGRP